MGQPLPGPKALPAQGMQQTAISLLSSPLPFPTVSATDCRQGPKHGSMQPRDLLETLPCSPDPCTRMAPREGSRCRGHGGAGWGAGQLIPLQGTGPIRRLP